MIDYLPRKNKINILGVDHAIRISTAEKDKNLKDADGYLDTTIKEIVIKDMDTIDFTVSNPVYYMKKVIRHEIIHAFLYESGVCDCETLNDEQMVDWIAWQYPKLKKAFEELGVEE